MQKTYAILLLALAGLSGCGNLLGLPDAPDTASYQQYSCEDLFQIRKFNSNINNPGVDWDGSVRGAELAYSQKGCPSQALTENSLTWIPAADLKTPHTAAVAHDGPPTVPPPLSSITPTTDTTTFCHAYLANKGQKGGAHSSLIKVSGPKTASSMLSAMVSFSNKAKASQPGKWGTFDVSESNCSVASGLCIKDNAATAQVLGQYCFATGAEAEAQIKQFNELDPGITQIE